MYVFKWKSGLKEKKSGLSGCFYISFAEKKTFSEKKSGESSHPGLPATRLSGHHL